MEISCNILFKEKEQVQSWECSVVTILQSKQTKASPRMRSGCAVHLRVNLVFSMWWDLRVEIAEGGVGFFFFPFSFSIFAKFSVMIT